MADVVVKGENVYPPAPCELLHERRERHCTCRPGTPRWLADQQAQGEAAAAGARRPQESQLLGALALGSWTPQPGDRRVSARSGHGTGTLKSVLTEAADLIHMIFAGFGHEPVLL